MHSAERFGLGKISRGFLIEVFDDVLDSYIGEYVVVRIPLFFPILKAFFKLVV